MKGVIHVAEVRIPLADSLGERMAPHPASCPHTGLFFQSLPLARSEAVLRGSLSSTGCLAG